MDHRTKKDKNDMAKDGRKMERKTTLIIISVVVLALVFLLGGIGVWKAVQSGPEATQTQSGEKENKKNSTGKDDNQEASDTDASIESYTVRTTERVRLRAKAEGESDILDVIPPYTELTATNETDGWLKVTYNEKEGYVSIEFTTTEEPKVEEQTDSQAQESANQAQEQPSQPQPASQLQGPRPATGGHIICIDPGHQSSGDSTPEPNGPGSGTMKARVTGGTSGRTTGVPEYQLNLAIALQLQQELQARGYTVYMTRTSHDVNISNKERAEFATSVGAEITVRLHANGSENTAVSGALALAPSAGNPYVAHLASPSQSLSQCVLNAYCAATGMNNQGVQANDTMTGINWCTMPVTILEMGYMTNPTDDTNMQDAGYQYNMVQGIANGIDQYFGW